MSSNNNNNKRRSFRRRSSSNNNWRAQQEMQKIHQKEQEMWACVYREPLHGIPKVKRWKGNQLSTDLDDLVRSVEPTEDVVRKRRRVLNTISEIITKFIPGSEVGVFGSVACGLDTSTSDVDVIIFFRNAVVPVDVHSLLRDVEIKLKEAAAGEGASEIKGKYLFLQSSRVPVVKITTDIGVCVDISCQNNWTLVGTRIVSNYMSEFPMLAPLVRLVKLWLKKRNIRPSRFGGLSSWGWALLVIFAYQQNKKEMNQYCQNKDLAGALTLFFKMFGFKINVKSHQVVSVRSARLINRKTFSMNLPPQLRAQWNPPANRSFIAIEEPVLRPPVDIASHIGDDVWQDTEAEMRRAYLLLSKGGSSGLELLFTKRVDMSQTVSQLCRSTMPRVLGEQQQQDEKNTNDSKCFLASLLSPDSKECCFVIVSRGAIASNGGEPVGSKQDKDELTVRLAVCGLLSQ